MQACRHISQLFDGQSVYRYNVNRFVGRLVCM